MTQNVKTLEDILKLLGAKKPFFETPRKHYDSYSESFRKEYLSKAGGNAYGTLIQIVYGLEQIGVLNNSGDIVDNLDALVDEG